MIALCIPSGTMTFIMQVKMIALYVGTMARVILVNLNNPFTYIDEQTFRSTICQ